MKVRKLFPSQCFSLKSSLLFSSRGSSRIEPQREREKWGEEEKRRLLAVYFNCTLSSLTLELMPSVVHFNVGCYLIIVRDFLFSTSFILDTIDENSGKKKVVRRKLNGCSKFPGTVSVKNRPSCFFCLAIKFQIQWPYMFGARKKPLLSG